MLIERGRGGGHESEVCLRIRPGTRECRGLRLGLGLVGVEVGRGGACVVRALLSLELGLGGYVFVFISFHFDCRSFVEGYELSRP